eukprot:4414409-Alexandrium_andersonii.AAC.1
MEGGTPFSSRRKRKSASKLSRGSAMVALRTLSGGHQHARRAAATALRGGRADADRLLQDTSPPTQA